MLFLIYKMCRLVEHWSMYRTIVRNCQATGTGDGDRDGDEKWE